jgi:ABC-2 type transport system ATP-binding protein
VTVLLTTHILEEAQGADRLGIMHEGRLVALDTPAALRETVGGDSITIETDQPQEVVDLIRERFDYEAAVVDGAVRLEAPDAAAWISRLSEALADRIDSITLGKPTLEDVFIERTGHRFWGETS